MFLKLKTIFFRSAGVDLTRKWILYGLILGSILGVTAYAFSAAVEWSREMFWFGYGFPEPKELLVNGLSLEGTIRVLFLPALGGLLVGLITYSVSHEVRGGGINLAIDSFHNHQGYFRRRVPFTKFLATMFTLGSGGSAGVEGPIALMSSSLGSSLARLFRLSVEERRIILIAGIAGGLGAIFKAPFGAALLSIEVFYREDYESRALIPALITAVASYFVFCSLTDFSPYFLLDSRSTGLSFQMLLCYIFLGVMVGIVARWFIGAQSFVKYLFSDQIKIHPILRPAIGGLAVGILAVFFPQILGSDWSGVTQIDLSGGPVFLFVLTALVVLKPLATALTVGSGGSGGLYGPSLTAGGLVGLLTLAIISGPFGVEGGDQTEFTLVGMASFFAAAAKVPVASAVMLVEMTTHYKILAPLLISMSVALVITGKGTIYTAQVEDRFHSPVHQRGRGIDFLKNIKMSEISEMMKAPMPRLSPRAGYSEIRNMFSNTDHTTLIVGDEEKVLGLISMERFKETLASDEIPSHVIVASDLLEDFYSLSNDENLHEALTWFTKSGLEELPVFQDKEKRILLGALRVQSILDVYDRKTRDS